MIHGRSIVRRRARKGKRHRAAPLAELRYAYGRFSHRRLEIHAAFPRYNKIRPFHIVRNVDGVEHQCDSRFQHRGQKADECISKAACGSRARKLVPAYPELMFHHFRKMPQAIIQLCCNLRRRPLLRAVYARRAIWPKERVAYIARNPKAALRKARIGPGSVDARHPAGCAAVNPRAFPRRCKEAEPKRRKHADSPVIRGAASDPDQKRTAAAFKRVKDHFTQTVGRGKPRVALFRRHKRQAAAARHLHDRHPAGQHTICAAHRFSKRPGYAHGHLLARKPFHKRIHSAFSSVRNRTDDNLRFRNCPQHALPHCVSCLNRRKAPFKRVNRDNNLHVSSPPPKDSAVGFV